MTHEKYSVLIMRDDRNVKRYRLSTIWFRGFLYLQILLVVAALAGSWGGWYLWRVNKKLAAENRAYELTVSEQRVRLERLENVEKILQSNNPEELQSLLGSLKEDPRTIAGAVQQVDLAEIFDQVDSHQVNVEKFQAQVNGQNMKASFELTDASGEQQTQLNLDMKLVARSGQAVPVKLGKDEATFTLSRSRKMNVGATLPQALSGRELFALRLTLTDQDGKTVFASTYPLQQTAQN